MMDELKTYNVWFVTGSQHLYGPEALKQVADDAHHLAAALNKSSRISCTVVYKPVVTTAEEIANVCTDANTDEECVGLIFWMHTFSPAKMWIAGLNALKKPFLHFHTQFYRDIPWGTIDMDYMNLHQSAHGGREFGYICTRMKKTRKVVSGHRDDESVLDQIDTWMRAACGWHDAQGAKIARFGDNMRHVAVTEGDKVGSQMQLGYAVDGYGIGDLLQYVDRIKDKEIDALVNEYQTVYDMSVAAGRMDSIREAARIEAGMRAFLEEGGFKAFTTTFENLYGLKQLPGLAVQRLMAEGYGFGAEGDWKTAALVRAMKVMACGAKGGTSFMEDYTYHLDPADSKVLGAHMLEICSSIASGKPSLEVHPLGIGGKEDPVRVVFNVAAGPAINASLIDMGGRLRLVVNDVEVVDPDADLPKLPVARAVWVPKPDLKTAASAWIYAGAAHHTGFSMGIGAEHMEDFAEIAGIEFLPIDAATTLREFKEKCRWNELYYRLR